MSVLLLLLLLQSPPPLLSNPFNQSCSCCRPLVPRLRRLPPSGFLNAHPKLQPETLRWNKKPICPFCRDSFLTDWLTDRSNLGTRLACSLSTGTIIVFQHLSSLSRAENWFPRQFSAAFLDRFRKNPFLNSWEYLGCNIISPNILSNSYAAFWVKVSDPWPQIIWSLLLRIQAADCRRELKVEWLFGMLAAVTWMQATNDVFIRAIAGRKLSVTTTLAGNIYQIDIAIKIFLIRWRQRRRRKRLFDIP